MTRKGRLVLLAAVVLYLAGAANDSQPAYSFASALVGILLIAYVLSRLAASGVRILQVSVPDRVMAEVESPLQVELLNAALIAKPRARVTYKLVPISLKGAMVRKEFRVPPLQRGAYVRVEAPLVVPWRGRWQLDGLRLEGSDPLGLFHRAEMSAMVAELVATPQYWSKLPVSWPSLLAPATRLAISFQRADRGEYRAIREYAPGDDVRHVHWRATAHRGKLSTKEYDRLREAQVQVWAAPVSAQTGVVDAAELVLSIAATIAHTFVMAPLPTVVRAVGLTHAAQGPGQGELFWRQLIFELSEVPYLPDPDLRQFAARWSQLVPPAATVYLISNSNAALATMSAVLRSEYAHAVLILAGVDDESALGASHLLIPAYDSIPLALTKLAQLQSREVVMRGT
jgi:uncharacterized protein (DUF58 family)